MQQCGIAEPRCRDLREVQSGRGADAPPGGIPGQRARHRLGTADASLAQGWHTYVAGDSAFINYARLSGAGTAGLGAIGSSGGIEVSAETDAAGGASAVAVDAGESFSNSKKFETSGEYPCHRKGAGIGRLATVDAAEGWCCRL